MKSGQLELLFVAVIIGMLAVPYTAFATSESARTNINTVPTDIDSIAKATDSISMIKSISLPKILKASVRNAALTVTAPPYTWKSTPPTERIKQHIQTNASRFVTARLQNLNIDSCTTLNGGKATVSIDRSISVMHNTTLYQAQTESPPLRIRCTDNMATFTQSISINNEFIVQNERSMILANVSEAIGSNATVVTNMTNGNPLDVSTVEQYYQNSYMNTHQLFKDLTVDLERSGSTLEINVEDTKYTVPQPNGLSQLNLAVERSY